MVQNHLERIPWTTYHGLQYHGPNTMDQNHLYASFLDESACICIRVFWSSNLCVYVTWLRGTCVYLFFLNSESLNCDLSFEWVAIKDNTCVIAPNLCHNANNLPLWTWWQPQVTQSHSPPLSSSGKGYAPPEFMLKSLLCCVVHAPPDYRQGLQEDVLQEDT